MKAALLSGESRKRYGCATRPARRSRRSDDLRRPGDRRGHDPVTTRRRRTRRCEPRVPRQSGRSPGSTRNTSWRPSGRTSRKSRRPRVGIASLSQRRSPRRRGRGQGRGSGHGRTGRRPKRSSLISGRTTRPRLIQRRRSSTAPRPASLPSSRVARASRSAARSPSRKTGAGSRPAAVAAVAPARGLRADRACGQGRTGPRLPAGEVRGVWSATCGPRRVVRGVWSAPVPFRPRGRGGGPPPPPPGVACCPCCP